MIDCMIIVNGEMKSSKQTLKMEMKLGFGSIFKYTKRFAPYIGYRSLEKAWLRYKDNPITVKEMVDLANRDNPKYPGRRVMLSPTIAYLGTFLHRQNLTFRYINSLVFEEQRFFDMLDSGELRAVAISTTYYLDTKSIASLVKLIRSRNNQVKIIVGGTFISNKFRFGTAEKFEKIVKEIRADVYIVDKQGETALCEVLQALKNNNDLKDVANIVYKSDKTYETTEIREEDNRLNENPVNWSLFEEHLSPMVFIRSCVSCPFSCAYCTYPVTAGEYYFVGVESIEKELDYLKKTNKVKHIFFTDDTFNIPKERFKEILRMMIRNQYDFKWDSFIRCQYIDEEAVDLMKQSGCQQVFLGIESGSQEILDNMNKKAKVDDYRKAIKLLKKYGINQCCSFIIGFPGETEETIEETYQFINECKPTYYVLNLWMYLHRAPIHQARLQYGLEGDHLLWKHNTMNSKIAINKVYELYDKITDSIHVPIFDFDLYLLYNLGMDQEQIRQMMLLFNQGVRQSLKDRHRKGISTELWNQLMQAGRCRI